jgi:hypothetical protein
VDQVADPEWGRSAVVFEKFGIGRTALDRLAREGRVRSVTIQLKAGSKRVTRLYSIQSIREFLNELVPKT